MNRTRALLTLAVLAAAPLLGADAAPPPPPHTAPPAKRPFADRPNILFYEGFEQAQKPIFFENGVVADKGAAPAPVPNKPAAPLAEQDPAAPSAHCYKFGEASLADDKIKKVVQTKLNLSAAQVAIPNGILPSQIKVEFGFWTEYAGELTLKIVYATGSMQAVRQNAKVNTWFKVDFSPGDLVDDKKKHLDPDSTLTAIEIYYKPKLRVDFPAVFLDDFIITLGSPAEELKFVAEAIERQADIEQTIEKNGFNFTMALQEKFRPLTVKAQARKHRIVLVLAASSAETSVLCKDLAAEAAKLKEAFVFMPAVDAGGSVPAGGIDDMRQLLLYNLQKTGAGFVLLCLNPADAVNSSATAASLHIMLDRVLGVGALPLVCAPPTPAGDKVGVFARSVDSNCTFFGVPWIDAGFALKDGKGGAYESGQLNVPGLGSVAALAVNALKRMREAGGL